MKIYRLKLYILLIIIVSLIIAIYSVLFQYSPNIWHGETKEVPDQFTPFISKIIGIYGVHIGVIFTCYLTNRNVNIVRNARVSDFLAFLLVTIWNIIFLIVLINNGIKLASVDFTILNGEIDQVCSIMNFLVDGALVYIFAYKM